MALSNEVTRLNKRLDVMEKERAEIKPSMQFIQKMMDEMRYEPVVQEELRAAP